MATIVDRAGKGSPLTNTELDANFNNLNAATVEGVVKLNRTAGEILAAGDVCYVHSDGKVWYADADAIATTKGMLLLALEATEADVAYDFLVRGIWTTTGLTPVGAEMYVSATPGGVTATAPTTTGQYVRIAGYALSATELWFNPDSTYVKVP